MEHSFDLLDILLIVDQEPYFKIPFLVFLGLCLGSFASAVAYRAPLGLPWAYYKDTSARFGWRSVRSICPKCDTILTPRDLIPLLSWLLSHGKCRHCHAPISPMYLLFESVTAVLYTIFCLSLNMHSLTFLIFTAAFPFMIVTIFNALRGQGISKKVLSILIAYLAVYLVHIVFTGNNSPYY